MGGSESRLFGTVTIAGGIIIYLTRVSEEHIGKTWEAELSTSKTMEKVKFTFSIPEHFSLTSFFALSFGARFPLSVTLDNTLYTLPSLTPYLYFGFHFHHPLIISNDIY